MCFSVVVIYVSISHAYLDKIPLIVTTYKKSHYLSYDNTLTE